MEAAAIVQVATMMPEVASNLTSKFEKEEVNMLKDSFTVSVARLMMQNDITCPFHSDAGRGWSYLSLVFGFFFFFLTLCLILSFLPCSCLCAYHVEAYMPAQLRGHGFAPFLSFSYRMLSQFIACSLRVFHLNSTQKDGWSSSWVHSFIKE